MSAPSPAFAPYGAWPSPITAADVAGAAVRLGHLAVEGPDLYWIEGRPAERGRNVVVRLSPGGEATDVTPPPTNARTRVHEYGGADFAVAGGRLVYSEFADQRLYLLDLRQREGPDGPPPGQPAPGQPAPGPAHRPPPRPLTESTTTPSGPGLRYADALFDTSRNRLLCVREDHRGLAPPGAGGPHPQPQNAIVAIDLAPPEAPHAGQRVLVSGNDFYASPRLSRDGQYLAWLTWNHPNMPWDGCELWTARLTPQGTVQDARRVAGGLQESIFQPEWGPDGRLYFVSDRSGWWNLYRLAVGGLEGAPGPFPDPPGAPGAPGAPGQQSEPEALNPCQAEFGQPQWVFGAATYGFLSPPAPGHPDAAGLTRTPALVCAFAEEGTWRLGRLDLSTSHLETIPLPYTDIRNLRPLPDGSVVLNAGAPDEPAALVRVDPLTGRYDVLRRSSDVRVDAAYLSVPRAVTFPTTGGQAAHAFYYPPANRDAQAPPGDLPPLLVKSHGGPTSATSSALTLGTQYWTSRGVAVLDVNYGGSTGYGREYRRRLEGQWGVVDVDDCVNGALALTTRGEVDPRRLLITGGSAGGYTTLCALAFRAAFRAGGSHYGVSDLEALARDTHKFESRYLDRLIGPYPDRRDLYLARSPIQHLQGLNCPTIFFQGLEDAVVPPAQTETMVEALRRKGVPVAYLPFEGEQHGFRSAANIARALDAEHYFYARVLGLPLPEGIDPVPIENLPDP